MCGLASARCWVEYKVKDIFDEFEHLLLVSGSSNFNKNWTWSATFMNNVLSYIWIHILCEHFAPRPARCCHSYAVLHGMHFCDNNFFLTCSRVAIINWNASLLIAWSAAAFRLQTIPSLHQSSVEISLIRVRRCGSFVNKLIVLASHSKYVTYPQ